MTDAVFQRCINPDCAATCSVDDTSFACPRCGGLLDVAYDWDRLPPPRSLREFEAKWADRTNPLSFSGVWRFRELLPFAAARAGPDHRRGADDPAARRQRGRLRRHGAGPAVPAVRGHEPLGQLQGQRHDGGVHARPHGRGPPGRLRQHRQHQRLAWPSSARPPA